MRFKSDDQRKAMFAKKKFYHGSAGFRGRVIGADGLIPPSQIDMPTSKDEMRGSEFDDYVFLTTNKDLAKIHAERRARHWEDIEYGPIVYEVELEEEQVVPDTFDPIRYPDSFKHKGIITSDKLKRVKFSDVGFDPRKTLELLDAKDILAYAETVQELKNPTIGELSKYADNKFSFWERKNKGWYPADSKLPDEFPTVMRNVVFKKLGDPTYITPDDDVQLTKLTGDVCSELDKVWKPEWGTRPSGHYLRADVKDAWEDLD